MNTTAEKMPIWINEPGKEISVLLPTRGRTESLKTSLLSLIDLANDPSALQFFLGFDKDDQATKKWFIDNVLPIMEERQIFCVVFEFEPLGYGRLNEYVNSLASHANGRWLMFWNDDAVMETSGWDTKITEYNGQFKVLRMTTHNAHPYAIFPIVPREWFFLMGHLCPHQISDAWISQIGFMLNIVVTIDVQVLHNRHDLTGENDDDTYKNRIMYEGNPNHPRDFNHVSWRQRRFNECNKIAWYLKSRGEDMSWFENIVNGTQDPWERMLSSEFDPNNQVKLIPGLKTQISILK